MSNMLRTLLFRSPTSSEESFRSAFELLGTVQILGELQDWESLRARLGGPGIDVVAVGLDDEDGQALDVVQRIANINPACAVIGISQNHQPAAIIGAMRAGCSQFVSSPIDPEDLRNALERIQARRSLSVQDSKRICVIGSAGGAGATTIGCNLALELAHFTARRCAIVDLNLEFGDVAAAFDCIPRYSIADVCRADVSIDATMLGNALHDLPSQVSILARPERIEAAHEVTAEGLQGLFSALRTMFPFVVVDVPRSGDYLAAAAVAEADRILLVTQLSVQYLRNATRIYKCLMDMGASESNIEIVINRARSGFERISPEDVEAHFGRPVLALIPNDYRRVQASLDLGQPIVTDSPDTPARLAIQKMARRLAGAADENLPRGLLGKLRDWSSREKKPASADS